MNTVLQTLRNLEQDYAHSQPMTDEYKLMRLREIRRAIAEVAITLACNEEKRSEQVISDVNSLMVESSFQKEIEEAAKLADETIAHMRRARQIDPDTLYQPMTI